MATAQSLDQPLQHAEQLRKQGQLAESAAVFQRVIDSGFEKGEAFYGLGLVHLDAGDLQSAATAFENALGIDPRNANAYYYLGQLWTARNAAEIAQSFYAKALEVNPQHAGALKKRQTSAQAANVVHGSPAKDSFDVSELGFYGLLKRDPSELARQTVQLIDRLNLSVRPALSAYLSRLLGVLLLCAIPAFAITLLSGSLASPSSRAPSRVELTHRSTPLRAPVGAAYLDVVQQILFAAAIVVPLAYIVRIKSTRYTFEKGRLQVSRGIFMRRVSNIELYRVVDIEMQQTFLNRLTRDGTIVVLVDGASNVGQQTRIALTGIAKGRRLQTLFEELRNLVLLLRTGNWGKGFIT
jgi:tetratricopeptide (TPR) repeat protein